MKGGSYNGAGESMKGRSYSGGGESMKGGSYGAGDPMKGGSYGAGERTKGGSFKASPEATGTGYGAGVQRQGGYMQQQQQPPSHGADDPGMPPLKRQRQDGGVTLPAQVAGGAPGPGYGSAVNPPAQHVPARQGTPPAGGKGGPGPAVTNGASVGEKVTYLVFTTDTAGEQEMVVKTLTGEYVEKGVNHGRKVFQKLLTDKKPDSVDVLLYYWDSRDGAAFEGWWFGNKLGGTQVWSHCKSSELQPPSTGWQIPWDGPVRHTICVMTKEAKMRQLAEEKYKELTAEAAKIEALAGEALQNGRKASATNTIEGYQKCEELIIPQVTAVANLGRQVGETLKVSGITEKDSQPFQMLNGKLRKMHQTLTQEVTKAKTQRQRAEAEATEREAEEADTKLLMEILPEAHEKTNAAEDMSEKATIVAAMLDMLDDEVDAMRQAVDETEKTTKLAQAAIGEARIFLNAKVAGTRRYCDKVKEKASSELATLQKKVQEAQTRLNPLRTIRMDIEQKRAAETLVADLEQRVAVAEIDLDRTDEMVKSLYAATPSQDGLKHAQQALQSAEEQVSEASALIEKKQETATEIAKQELAKFVHRSEVAHKRITDLKASLKSASERVTTEGFVKEASEKVQEVTSALAKLEEAEAGVNSANDASQSGDESKTSEAIAATAQTAASAARMSISMKMLEVKRFSKGPATEASGKLLGLQKQLEVATKRLGDYKASIAKRKRLMLVKAAESRVAAAEELVVKLQQATDVLADDIKLSELTPEQIKEAGEKAAQAEKEASEALSQVRKEITTKQIEAKGKDAFAELSADFAKIQARLTTAVGEVNKMKKLYTSVDQRIAAQKKVLEIAKKVTETEEKVTKAAEVVAAIKTGAEEQDEANAAAAKAAEQTCLEAQIAIRQTSRHVESQMRSSPSKETITKLQDRLKKAQDALDSASGKLKGRQEATAVQGILSECRTKLQELEDSLAAADETETPLREGTIEGNEALQKSLEVEKAIQAAQATATSAKTAISMKRLAAKRLSEGVRDSTSDSLTEMLATVEARMKQVTEMRARASQRKSAAHREAAKATAKPSPKPGLRPSAAPRK